MKTVFSRSDAPLFLCAILLIAIISQISFGVISLLSLDKATAVRHDQGADVKTTKPVLFHRALNTTFFGDYVPNHLNDADIKASRLDLRVVGILFADKERDSHVIIQMAGGHEQTFKVGDKLPGGVIIKRIKPQGVLIGREGVLERLNLPQQVLTFEPPAQPIRK
jgi:general secretion pathway protein C